MKAATVFGAIMAIGLAACAEAGTTADAKTAADAAKGALHAGTKVCISDLVGVRYALEDALRQQDLEPTSSCTAAKVRLQESGAPNAWILRYQRLGDSKWKECKSSERDRGVFAEQCIGQMRSDLGG